MKKITYLTFIYFLFTFISQAELLKPNSSIKPYQVVKLQLSSLMNNDNSNKDNGIKQTWQFAHPNNQKYTGPLERFKILLHGKAYNMLLNHLDHKIVKLKLTNSAASYDVIILDENKTYYKFNLNMIHLG